MSENSHASLTALSQPSDDVLSRVQVFNMLLQLERQLQTLPSLLPLPENGQSCYAKLLSFHPLPSDWVDDIGTVATVNRQLEIAFGTRAFGLKLKERGSVIESVVPILRHYLFTSPGDVILQKWLRDLFQAASTAHIEASGSAQPTAILDLTDDTSDDDGLPRASVLLAQACQSKRRQSNSPVPEDTTVEKSDTEEADSGTKKQRKTHKKRKGPLPPQDDIKTLPTKTDPRMIDLPELNSDPSKGGAPANPLVRKLTHRCYRMGMSSTDVLFRCIASSQCRHRTSSRHVDRVLKHAARCDSLKRMEPELHGHAIQALAEYSKTSSSTESATPTGSTSPANVSSTPKMDSSEHPPATSDIFARFRDKGGVDFRTQATLAVVRLVCATGIPPRILDSPEWRRYCDILLSKSSGPRYRPPSATTLSDKLIPARAAQVTLDMRKILSEQYNLTLSFDGLTKGKQSLYTVHVITPDRHVFLYKGDVFRGSHNAEYAETLLKEVVDEIGVSHVAAVVSDDTNMTKKARRDFTTSRTSILNLADPIHKINLIAKDICMDPEWKESLERVFDESSMQATKFKMALIQFTQVLRPIFRALTCLESSNSTLGDVFAYWLAMLAALDHLFTSPECTLLPGVVSRLRTIVNVRYMEAIENAPTNAYIGGFFLHPGFRNADVFRRMNAISSKLYIRIPAQSPTSPVSHIPDLVYKRIRHSGSSVLRYLLKVAESDTKHDLHGYDAEDAKSEFEAQLAEYALGHYPFHRPLGSQETVASYWRSLKSQKEAFILATVGEKLASVLPNSMCDERTGSHITFLNPSLRSRTDAKTMIEQIQVMQWYSMTEGSFKPKARTAAHFRDLDQIKLVITQQKERDISEGAGEEEAGSWLDCEAEKLELESVGCDMEELTSQLSTLQIVNLQSPLLMDMLSISPIVTSLPDNVTNEAADSQAKGKGKERATTADEVDWD
ncbi:hypothetical protein FRC07_001459 [Ceratobasidium sp. 392]|nr:hypothetical protein FRC07_001459 [Ceratobasidium sp. 392]